MLVSVNQSESSYYDVIISSSTNHNRVKTLWKLDFFPDLDSFFFITLLI